MAIPPIDHKIEAWNARILAVILEGRRVPVRAVTTGDRIFVWCEGDTFEFNSRPPTSRGARPTGDDAGFLAPMPGKILRLAVAEGDRVARGATLLVLEAMKMEHEIKAPRDGVVMRLPFRSGDQVEAGATLVDFA